MPRYYRLTVLVCALSWFLVGLHMPAIHEVTDHGRSLPWSVALVVGVLVLIGVGGIWALLRAPAWRDDRDRSGVTA